MRQVGSYTLNAWAGEDWSETFTWTAGGTPVDLTGYVFRGQIVTLANVYYEINITTPSAGVIQCTIPASESQNIPVGNHKFEIRYRVGSVQEQPWLTGRAIIHAFVAQTP